MGKGKAPRFQSRSARPKEYQHSGPKRLLDIVVPVYGRPDLLRQCLAGVEVNTLSLEYQLVLVDDKSPNAGEMEPVYASLDGKARVIRHNQNAGFPRTCNEGAAQGTAPAILFLNTDVMLQPGAIQAMLDALFGDDTPPGMVAPQTGPVGVVGPMLLFPEDSVDPSRPAGKVQHAGMGFNLSGRPIHVNIGWSRDNPKLQMRRCVQMVTGACMMVRREAWNTVMAAYRATGDPSGGFNLVYGRGTFEDVELCFAARSNGYRVVYEPRAVGYHHVGASSASQGASFDLQRNESIFRARCGHLMLWDEWLWF